ncbi:MAG: hypothetical protein ABIZ04_09525 [Opitutus sp.]
MTRPVENPFLMQAYASPADVSFGSDAVIIRGTGPEPRHTPVYAAPARYVDITVQDSDSFVYHYEAKRSYVALRNRTHLKEFLTQLAGNLFIDMTALSHHIWAPILRTALMLGRTTRVLYIEPEGYVRSPTGVEGEIFDLSERINGVAAIPGFASLSDEFEDRICFVPMLGFEGKRTAHVWEQVQPQGNKIYPIIGLPGFRLEFPFYTVQSNQRILHETQAWKNVRYAAANNPFSVYDTLCEIQEANTGSLLKIAPIGTKPHALGAFLYPLKSRRTVEFVYDFPIRKSDRTIGVGKVFVYRVSEFMA